jgi:hypothetical protein
LFISPHKSSMYQKWYIVQYYVSPKRRASNSAQKLYCARASGEHRCNHVVMITYLLVTYL